MSETTTKPAGITCPDWERDPGGHPKRCRHYNANGACRLPAYLMCVEWLKVNPARATAAESPPSALALLAPPAPPAPAGATAADPTIGADGALVLAPTERRGAPSRAAPGGAPHSAFPILQGGPSAAEAARAAWAELGDSRSVGLGSVGLVVPDDGWVAAKAIDPNDLESLERTCEELHLVSPDIGDVWLVRARTGKDRNEITFREMSVIRLMVDAFPGARLVQLRRPSKDGG